MRRRYAIILLALLLTVLTQINGGKLPNKEKAEEEPEKNAPRNETVVSRVSVEELNSPSSTSEGTHEASVAGAAEGEHRGNKDFIVKESPVRKDKLRPDQKNITDVCQKVQDRMATYESLSEMRGNTLPELLVIDRFVDSLPQRCKEIYWDLDKHKASLVIQKASIQNRLVLHCKSLINAIPIYKWFLQDKHLVDRGEDCYETGIRRAIQEAHKSGRLNGKVLPVFKRRYQEIDFDYTEYVFNELSLIEADDIHTYSLKDYINFANEYSDIVNFIRSQDLSLIPPEEFVELAQQFDEEEYTVIVVEEYDDGDKSPFEIKRFNTYAISSEKGVVEVIGEGACHYNSQFSVFVLAMPVVILFILSFLFPIVSRILGLISIPENCLDTMSYMIGPLAFIIGFIMPYVINFLPGIIGFELPQGNVELLKNLHYVIIIVALFRISPLIGMVAFCVKANMYTEYLRENWFLIIVTFCGVLGNLSWLILGMLMEMSYTGTLIFESFMTATKNIFQPGMEGGLIDLSEVPEIGKQEYNENYFFEESNFMMLADLSVFILNTSIFMIQSIILAQYASDVMCGRNSKMTYVGLPFTFIGSNISYGLLFFCFSCLHDAKFYWNRISFFVGLINILFLCRCNLRRRVKRKIDPGLEAQENVPTDQEAKRFLATKNNKGMVKKLASKYGTPFVGVHREIVREIYIAASEERQEQFFLYTISGRRGTGKTRLVYECFKKPERTADFKVLQGEAGVKDDDKSKDMDLEDEREEKGNVKVQKCQPFEPIRKAIGNVVGINVFSSPSQQLSMIKNATDFADSFNGLSFLFSVDNKEETSDEAVEIDDSKQMSDVHVLADSLSKILIKEAKRYHKEQGKKLVLLFEDMEYADKNSLDFLKALVKIFAGSYKSIPMIIVILYRELPGSDEGENNEKRIDEIVKVANDVAKKTGGGTKFGKIIDLGLEKKHKENKEKNKDKDKDDDEVKVKHKKFEERHKIAKHYHLANLTEYNLAQLLDALCFVDEEIPDISKWLYNKTKGKLYWVSVCLQNLFIERYAEASLRGWKIAPGKSLREIAIPNKMAQALETKFRKMDDEALKLLQIAAECGMQFNSNLLAKIKGKTRLEIIYQLNKIQEEYNIISEHEGSAKRNDQGNDTLSGEFVFTSVVYVDAMRSMTRNYGNNMLFAKQIQLNIFDILCKNINMSQRFLNSFFFYMDKFEFQNDQGELKFSLEERWGNAYIEIVNFRKLPLEFKFRLAEHARDSSLERPFEALVAFTMASLTAKDLWDAPNIIKYSELAINEAKSIIQNQDEIDELYEWLEKIGRCGFSSEGEILEYIKHLLSELLIIESQNMLDSSPKDNSKDIIEKLDSLEDRIGKLPPKAQVIRALAYIHIDDLETSIVLSEKIYQDESVIKLYKADACFAACYAGFKDEREETWQKSIACADKGIETMLEFIKEEKKKMKSRKIRQQAKEIMGKLLLTKGMIYHFKFRNLKECEKCYTEALDYKKQVNDVLGCAKTNGLLGKLFYTIAADLKRRNDNEHTYSTRNNLDRAISYYEEYYKLASKIENKEGLIEAPKGLGNCYMELEKYDNALKSYEKSAQRAIEFKDDIRKAEAFCQIIKALILKGDGKEKEEEKKGEKPDMIQGVKEPQGEDAYKKYFDEVLEICKVHPKNKKINNYRKGLMEFIEDQKHRNRSKEKNSMAHVFEEDDFYSDDY